MKNILLWVNKFTSNLYEFYSENVCRLQDICENMFNYGNTLSLQSKACHFASYIQTALTEIFTSHL